MVAQIERTLCALGAGRNAAWGVVSGTGHITRAGTLHGQSLLGQHGLPSVSRDHAPSLESPSAAHSARTFRKSWGGIPKLMGHRSDATYKVPHFPPESRPTSIGISAPLPLESVPHFVRNPHPYI